MQSPGTPLAAFADLLASTLTPTSHLAFSPVAGGAGASNDRLDPPNPRIPSSKPPAFFSAVDRSPISPHSRWRGRRRDHSFGRLRIYASSETHFSIAKAATLLGIGRENVRHIAVDEHFRMRVDDLVARINADLENGYVPFCAASEMPEPWIRVPSTP